MDPSFVRQQIQAKIEEFRLYLAKYLDNAEREKTNMHPYLKKEEVKEFENLIANLKKFERDAIRIYDEIDLIAVRFGVLYEIYSTRLEEKAADRKKGLPADYSGIDIPREELKYSTFAVSVGYNEELQLLDLEFTGGKIYRYRNVPKEFYEKIIANGSLRELNKELKSFEFERLA